MDSRKTGRYASLAINVPMPPPHWALLERELLRAQEAACAAFYAKYFDERGYLLCIPRWGGNDGPDDAGENLLNWPMLHALGASDSVLAMYKQGWDGHLRQYSEAKTVHVPMAREGMYYKEFSVMFDWMHHGEWISPFILEPLSNPADHRYEQRIRRYAGFYMDEDPQALNYDPEHNLIRSMFNGSRGPMLRKSTALDWAGDPIEVAGRFDAKHGENSFAQMLDHFRDYNDVAGDHPLNLAVTTVALTAFALTGEAKYRDWIVRYVDGWVAHTKANNGIIPTNIGLDGTIGGACDGKWYGGVYGWGFSVIDYNTGKLAHRPAFQQRAVYGFGNAVLMTGDQSYLAVWREMLDAVNANEKIVDGKPTYPYMYGDAYGEEGWYDFRPEPFAAGAHELYYLSMDPQDLARAPQDPWYDFLAGRNPDYPVEALQRDYATVRQRIEKVRRDATTTDTRLSDDMNAFNPAITDALIRLTLGGFPTGREGGPLYCRLRYFDPARRRAGLPEDVAALVDHLTAAEVGVTLVNLDPVAERTLIVQGGAYAEHQFISATAGGITTEVNGPNLVVRLAPGAGERITLTMQRYANQPTLSFPWV